MPTQQALTLATPLNVPDWLVAVSKLFALRKTSIESTQTGSQRASNFLYKHKRRASGGRRWLAREPQPIN